MGRSGNQPGFKVFSINTTVRNPVRNTEFLKSFEEFENKPFDSDAKERYLYKLVRNGVYRFTNLDQTVKEKLKLDIQLTDSETRQAFHDNPQATGFANRVVTQLRSLKDQGFLKFTVDGKGGKPAIYSITSLGHELLDNNIESNDVYCKAMIGMHAYSPIRETMYNRSRPFLNTLFVINEVNRLWAQRGESPKGILKHEFAAFVLSMKDCNYKEAAKRIIDYRIKFGKVEKESFIEKYLFDTLSLNKVAYKSIMKDYVDDVYRKFEMTGLIRQRGAYTYTYIDFSLVNIGKVKLILNQYHDYKFETFANKDEYYEFLDTIKLPWLSSEGDRKVVLQSKADALGVDISGLSLNDADSLLNRISSQTAISSQVSKYSEDTIEHELLIISRDADGDSIFESLPEALRLEFLLALLIGKKYGANYIISNLIYSDEGMPLSFAPSGKADIVYNNPSFGLIIEATTIRDRTQQLNSETTNLTRHMKDLQNRTDKIYHMSLVAPYIHADVCDYFQFKSISTGLGICPLTISRLVEITELSNDIDTFSKNYDTISLALRTYNTEDFLKFINEKYFGFIEKPDETFSIGIQGFVNEIKYKGMMGLIKDERKID